MKTLWIGLGAAVLVAGVLGLDLYRSKLSGGVQSVQASEARTSLYEMKVQSLSGEPINLSSYRGKVALVVSSRIHSPGLQEAWRTLHVLRQCGLYVYVDHSHDPAHETTLLEGEYDGVILATRHVALAAEAGRRGLHAVTRWLEDAEEPRNDWSTTDDDLASPLLAPVAALDERLIRTGRETQVSTGPTVTARW